jgi:L-ascorbate metabolism protein UlaG (beta-lactamase superfamily)
LSFHIGVKTNKIAPVVSSKKGYARKSGERRLPACSRRQLAEDIFAKPREFDFVENSGVSIFLFHIRDIRAIRGQVRLVLLFLLFAAQAFGAGLAPYAQLVVSDSDTTPHDGVRVTYLGTNGYQFEFKHHALLVDPYFSRGDLLSVAVGSHIQPNVARINDGLRHLAQTDAWSSAFRRHGMAPESRVNAELQTSSKVDAILVTHGHFDHLLDVPIIMSKTHARLIASKSSVDLARRAGASNGDAVRPGDVRRIGPWKIRVLPATHDRLFGCVPFDGTALPAGVPERAADWICGEPLAFLIEANGQRIYIDSGGTPAQLPLNEHVDLAILGMALPDSRARLAPALERLKPRYILPSHQDGFFRPLSAGFEFGFLTDFPRVQRECAREHRGRLILMDYFQPWTLPKAGNPRSQKGIHYGLR